MTEILSAVSPLVFSWSMLGRRSSAAFLLPRPEKGVWWPTPCRTHPVQVAAVALKLTYLVSISRNVATGRATWRHLSSSPDKVGNAAQWFEGPQFLRKSEIELAGAARPETTISHRHNHKHSQGGKGSVPLVIFRKYSHFVLWEVFF